MSTLNQYLTAKASIEITRWKLFLQTLLLWALPLTLIHYIFDYAPTRRLTHILVEAAVWLITDAVMGYFTLGKLQWNE